MIGFPFSPRRTHISPSKKITNGTRCIHTYWVNSDPSLRTSSLIPEAKDCFKPGVSGIDRFKSIMGSSCRRPFPHGKFPSPLFLLVLQCDTWKASIVSQLSRKEPTMEFSSSPTSHALIGIRNLSFFHLSARLLTSTFPLSCKIYRPRVQEFHCRCINI